MLPVTKFIAAMVTSTALLFLLTTFAHATPPPQRLVVHERRTNVPQGFVSAGPPSDNAAIDLRIGLYSRNIPGLEAVLYDVSTPTSPKYGQHLTVDELKPYVSPANESVDAVQQWLSLHGLKAAPASFAGEWVSLRISISKANKLLNANYEAYTHVASGKQILRTLSYSVPSNLVAHIETIHPTTSFDKPVSVKPIMTAPLLAITNIGDAIPSSCSSGITPACIQSLYNVPTTPAIHTTNQIAVPGFIQQFAQQADLQAFLKKFRPDISPSTTFSLQTLDGGSNPQGPANAGIEANLDIQYTIGVATNVPVVFISVGENTHDGGLGGFLDIVNFLLGESNRPQVMTTSYGADEADISSSLAIKLCNSYMQLGAVGTSNLFASGDGGTSGSQFQSCAQFQPTFPSGCPFLTSVGATTGIPEIAANLSSGGFSNVFQTPSYQSKAVSAYLKALGSTNSGLFKRTGRAFPDVAAQGENITIVTGGVLGGVSGTSCSSPIFASIIALINDRLATKGKRPLGFLNPLLYANQAAFNDITQGSNPGCNTQGFPAKAGWDPVTGLGTPDFKKLLAAAAAAAGARAYTS